jgi:cell division protein FtsI/penicillin-binding protein 2
MQHDSYAEKAERQYVHTVSDLYNRGSIFFATKTGERVSAATIQAGYVLSVDPTRLVDAAAAYEAINAVYPLEREQFMRRAAQPERTYVEIAARVSADDANLIEALDLDGIQLYRSQWRYYPGDTMSARSIGFVGYSDDESEGLIGRFGMERYYNDVLTREEKRTTVNFFAEIFSNFGSVVFDTESSRTGDVVSTIEPTVARMLDKVLADVQEDWSSNITGGIIMNPKTGAIYALNAAPTFDLNDRGEAGIDAFRNPLVEDVYEMGSISRLP